MPGVITPEIHAKSIAAKRAHAAEKMEVLKGILQRRKESGQPKPKESETRTWLQAAGFKRGLASVDTNRLIIEVYGAGRQAPPKPKLVKPNREIEFELRRRLDSIEAKLDTLLDIWKS